MDTSKARYLVPWRLVAAFPDYFIQLSILLRDPIYRGATVPFGKGQPILLIPGFLAGDWTLGILAGWLNRMGYRAYLSGIDWNVDCPNSTGELLGWRLDAIQRETNNPLIVIGHSLGGMLARFLGANFPERIRYVVALGSPIDGSMRVNPLVPLTFQTLQSLRRERGRAGTSMACGSRQCPCRFAQTVFSPLPETVGFTSIFTKKDEVVDWRACLDPERENLQVDGGHLGLIVNRGVYRLLAQILADLSHDAESPLEPL